MLFLNEPDSCLLAKAFFFVVAFCLAKFAKAEKDEISSDEFASFSTFLRVT